MEELAATILCWVKSTNAVDDVPALSEKARLTAIDSGYLERQRIGIHEAAIR